MGALYVHIPFCHAKCAYCDFYSIANPARIADAARAIAREYALRRGEVKEPMHTLYFGGGTPSILPGDVFSRLAGVLKEDTVEEFTTEVNPEDVSPEKTSVWKEAGVNRVSMGIQSFDDDELHTIRRRHTAAEAVAAFKTLRDAGISNISLDLIYALPGQTLESWKMSVDRLLSLHPEHFSAYCLSYEPGTLLNLRLKRGEITPASDELVEAMYGYLCEAARHAGYEHYEISNFALPGFRSRHNSSYWNRTPYLGLGPGAHSCDSNGLRRYNPPDLKQYLSALPAFETEEESAEERANDTIITALRTAEGLDPEQIVPEFRSKVLRAAAPHLASGNLSRHNNRIYIPESRWLISDSIIRDLIIV